MTTLAPDLLWEAAPIVGLGVVMMVAAVLVNLWLIQYVTRS